MSCLRQLVRKVCRTHTSQAPRHTHSTVLGPADVQQTRGMLSLPCCPAELCKASAARDLPARAHPPPAKVPQSAPRRRSAWTRRTQSRDCRR